jgi:hypothetical protein
MGQVYGQSDNNPGVFGESTNSQGVFGTSTNSYGVLGRSIHVPGVVGDTVSQYAAVWANNGGSGPGLLASANLGGPGVLGTSNDQPGVNGRSNGGPGVLGESLSNDQPGVRGVGAFGLMGTGSNGNGVFGETTHDSHSGVYGASSSLSADTGGVKGVNSSHVGNGVYGYSTGGNGVRGNSPGGVGVFAQSTSYYGMIVLGGLSKTLGRRIGGIIDGEVTVFGGLAVYGGDKNFTIDHPLDPQNKYLVHNTVESPERKNVYDGVKLLDEGGEAWVDLPEWFEALNGDFRYQLTAVGQAAPNLHVAEEIYENNRFKIAGGEGGMRVCWQVTGTRKDRWAAANPFEVEQEKPQAERGRYLHPDLYGAPEEQSVMRARIGEDRWQQMMRQEPPQEPPQAPEMPPRFDLVRQHEEHRQQIEELNRSRLVEEQRQQIDELRGQIEELRRGRVEDEIDELRRQVKKLRRRRKR